MFDDPTFDGLSYMVVGDRLLEAARERPTIGLALARDRTEAAVTRAWFVGTRVVPKDPRETADVRFDGGAPPLAALARRMAAGEFVDWFEGVKAGVDSGLLQPMRLAPVLDPADGGARATHGNAAPAIERLAFEAVDTVPSVRCRARHR